MDDFINKVGLGPESRCSATASAGRARDWLINGGARIEQSFKYYQRRHQLPTQVWYKAYPGLALVDLKRNHRIREGLERADDERCAGAGLAEAAMSTRTALRSSSTTSRAWCASATSTTPRRRSCCCGSPIATRRARWLATVPVSTRRRRSSRRPRPRCRSRSPARACAPWASATTIVDAFAAEFVAGMAERRQPRAPARRHRRERSEPLAMGRRRARAARRWCCSMRCRASSPRCSEAIEAQCDAGFEQHGCLADDRSRRHRAVRLHATASRSRRSTGSASAPVRDGERSRLHQPELPGRVPARLSERVRRLHRPAAARRRRATATRSCRAPRTRPTGPTWAATAATSSCASCARTCTASGSSLDRCAGGDAERARAARERDGRPHAATASRSIGPTDETIEGGGAPGDLNAFTYRADPQGLRCPLGAHIRRSNPRNADLPPGAPGHRLVGRCAPWASTPTRSSSDLVASTRFHRLLRRGREYGVGGAAGAGAGGAGARHRDRPALHLPQRQHRAPVRVRAERLGRWACNSTACRRERSAARHAPAAAPTARPPTASRCRAADGPDRRVSPACRSS